MTTTLILAALAHTLFSALMLRRQARVAGGWRLPWHQALLGQLALTVAGVVAAGLFVVVASEFGINAGANLAILGLCVLVATWAIGLAMLVPWLAQMAKGAFISPWSMKRVSGFTFSSVLVWYGCATLVASAAWWISRPPPGGDSVVAAAGAMGEAPKPATPPAPAEVQPAVVEAPAPGPVLVSDTAPSSAPASAAVPAPASVPAPARVAAAAPVPAPAPVPATLAPADGRAAVMDAVNAWAAAWSRRDADAYLAAYAPGFRAPDGLSRAAWEKLRRQRIGAASSITVRVDAPEVAIDGADTATVRFRQDYRSNLLSNADKKTLRLARQDGHWRIVEERSGE
jgi:hypothetical protein